MSELTTKAQEKSDSRELSSEELDAVSGGWFEAFLNYEQTLAAKTFAQVLQQASSV
jgi:hypothetical protein